MLNPKEFGQNMRNARFRQGYRTIPGIDKEVLVHIERGHRYPTLEELYLIAEGTSIPLWELLPLPEGRHHRRRRG